MALLPTSSTTTVELTIVSGSDDDCSKSFKRRVGETVIIGRASKSAGEDPDTDNGLFRNQVLSRQHALIEWKKDAVYIKDMKSTHGTRMSNQAEPISQAGRRLNTGDVLTLGKTIVRADGDKIPRSYEPLILQVTVTPTPILECKPRQLSATGPQAVLRKYVLSAKEQLFTDEEDEGSQSSTSQVAAAKSAQEEGSIISDDDEDEIQVKVNPTFKPRGGKIPSCLGQRCMPPPSRTQLLHNTTISVKPPSGTNASPIVISGSDCSSVRGSSPLQASSPPPQAPPTVKDTFVRASALLAAKKPMQETATIASQKVLPSSQANEHPSSELEEVPASNHRKPLVDDMSEDQSDAEAEEVGRDEVDDEDIEHDEDNIDEDEDEDAEDAEDDQKEDQEEEQHAGAAVDEIIHIGALLPMIIAANEAETEDEEMNDGSDNDSEKMSDEEDDFDDDEEDGAEESDDEEENEESSDEDEDNDDEDEMSEDASQIFDTSPVKKALNVHDRNSSVSSEAEEPEPAQKKARVYSASTLSDGQADHQSTDTLEKSLAEIISASTSIPLPDVVDGQTVNILQAKKAKKPMRNASTQMEVKRQTSLAVQTVDEDGKGMTMTMSQFRAFAEQETKSKSKKRTREVMVETEAVELVRSVEGLDLADMINQTSDLSEASQPGLQAATPLLTEPRPKKGLPWRAAAKYTSAMALGAVAAVIGLAAIPELD